MIDEVFDLTLSKLKEHFLMSLNGAMLPDTVMQAVNLLVHLTFICSCVLFKIHA